MGIPTPQERERWMELTELAAQELDPAKLFALVHEINILLEEKQKRINDSRASN